MEDWIATTEELPKCQCLVWCWSDILQCGLSGYYDEDKKLFLSPVEKQVIPEVSYWMPFPAKFIISPYQLDLA